MRVSIVIPNRGQGRFLPAALNSVFEQAGVNVEVAVLDASSTDESLVVIRRYAEKLAYWRSGPDAGQAAAINEGLTCLENGDYVGWLNADDLLLPGGLSRMAAYLGEHPECVAVFGKAYVIDEAGQVIDEYPARPFNRRDFAKTCTICQPASLVRRTEWQAVGGLDESLHMCMDYDIWWRLSKRGPIGFVKEFVACSRDHPATKTRLERERLYHEAFQVLRRHLDYVPWRWCVSEAAYSWRAIHGGERARGLPSKSLCGWRALKRYFRVNGFSQLINALIAAGLRHRF